MQRINYFTIISIDKSKKNKKTLIQSSEQGKGSQENTLENKFIGALSMNCSFLKNKDRTFYDSRETAEARKYSQNW